MVEIELNRHVDFPKWTRRLQLGKFSTESGVTSFAAEPEEWVTVTTGHHCAWMARTSGFREPHPTEWLCLLCAFCQ